MPKDGTAVNVVREKDKPSGLKSFALYVFVGNRQRSF
jgi:hypothetical protein